MEDLKKKREQLTAIELQKTQSEGESDHLSLSQSERKLFKIYFAFVKIIDFKRTERSKENSSELVKELLFSKSDEEFENEPIQMSDLQRIFNDESTARMLNYSVEDLERLFLFGSQVTDKVMDRILQAYKVRVKKKTNLCVCPFLIYNNRCFSFLFFTAVSL